MTRRHFFGGLAACALYAMSATHALAQGAAAASSVLKVGGDVGTPLSLTRDELKAMPRTQVDLKSEDGRVTRYDGVLVADILKRAGAPLGSDLRGDALASYVLAVASDGYQVVFSLAELDPALTSNQIIVADSADGGPLAAKQGPLRIVTPKDARPSRSVRMLERLDVVRLRK